VRFLLDTCPSLWIAAAAAELSQRSRELFSDPDNEVYLNFVSAWEIALKHALGRLPLPEPPGQFVPAERRRHGVEALALDEESALHLARLPGLHRDPFDRMLVCQALVQGLVILTPDPLTTQYPVRAMWSGSPNGKSTGAGSSAGNPPWPEAGASGVSDIPEKVEQLTDRLQEPPGLRREWSPGTSESGQRSTEKRSVSSGRGAGERGLEAGEAGGARQAGDREPGGFGLVGRGGRVRVAPSCTSGIRASCTTSWASSPLRRWPRILPGGRAGRPS